MALDLSTDYRTFDNLEAGTLTSKLNSGDVSVSVTKALRRALTDKELSASGGKYASFDMVWHLPVARLGGYVPKMADTWTDTAGGIAWTILEVGLNTLQSMYRCVTRNPTIAYNLRDLISLWVPNATKDEGKQRIPAFYCKEAKTPAAVYDESSEQVVTAGKMGTQKNVKIVFLNSYPTFSTDWQIRNGDTRYEIKSFEKTGQIGELMQANTVVLA